MTLKLWKLVFKEMNEILKLNIETLPKALLSILDNVQRGGLKKINFYFINNSRIDNGGKREKYIYFIRNNAVLIGITGFNQKTENIHIGSGKEINYVLV